MVMVWIVSYILICPSLCMAHAHIFIDYTVTAEFDANGLKGMRAVWAFDRMFSSFIIKQFDRNNDRSFSKEEISAIRNNAFHALAKDAYFAHVSHNKKNLPVPQPADFSAKIIGNNDIVQYSFFIPLAVAADGKEQEVSLFFFDPVIYVSFTITKKDVSVSAPPGGVDARIELKKVKYTARPTVKFKKGN